MKTQSWPEIWLEIGEAFETPFKERTDRQLFLTTYSNLEYKPRIGICGALDNLDSYDVNYLGFPERPAGIDSGYWLKLTDGQDLIRALFCYFMAAMGKDFIRFSNWCQGNPE